MNLRKYLLILLAFSCFGCSSKEEIPEFYVLDEPPAPSLNLETANRPKMIALQNLKSRILVYCYDGSWVSAEECAQKFENEGYVRLNDIPRFPAQYDFLKDGTYPTRRWRNDEFVPRW